jgi:hypothetical protein
VTPDEVQRAMAARSVADGLKQVTADEHRELHAGQVPCDLNGHVACPCITERIRQLELYALTPEERQAVVLRITGAQTVERMPDYRVHLESARRKLADGGTS